jgi:hypothetical protein
VGELVGFAEAESDCEVVGLGEPVDPAPELELVDVGVGLEVEVGEFEAEAFLHAEGEAHGLQQFDLFVQPADLHPSAI